MKGIFLATGFPLQPCCKKCSPVCWCLVVQLCVGDDARKCEVSIAVTSCSMKGRKSDTPKQPLTYKVLEEEMEKEPEATAMAVSVITFIMPCI